MLASLVTILMVVEGAQQEFFNMSWWIGLAIGAVIAVFLEMFLYEFLPDKLKDSWKYLRKRIGKRLRPRKVDVELIVKTQNVHNNILEVENTLETLRKELSTSGYNPAKQQDSLLFDIPIGKSIVHASINVAPASTEEKVIVDEIECRFKHECGYTTLDRDVYELREAQVKIQSILRKIVADFKEELSLVCELKSLYELTGVLSDVKIGMLSSSLEEGKIRFDLADSILTVYGKEINAGMLSFLKKMIVMYF